MKKAELVQLIIKAQRIFKMAGGELFTGEGLSRLELRILERKHIVGKRLMKSTGSGMVTYRWRML